MKHVIKHLRKDPVLASVLDQITLAQIRPRKDHFSDLCESIISQQLSEKAGATIWNRFLKLFPKEKVTPERVLALPDAKIRAVGTSWSKITYLKNIAAQVRDKKVHLDGLHDMTNEDIIAELTQVKGIGPWTAEMFLMFSLGREDVFSYGDLGLRNAMKKLYKFRRDPSRKQMEKIVKRWSPYRTYAARVLWKSLDL